ncbi:MAG: MoaD/ThiS family protein [Cellvibrionaceae bacterium]|nr:MoaD/ThiS family protein [Cellvibrionaceae bacterium]
MPFIVCTQHLREVGPSHKELFSGRTVREVLHNAAERYPRLSGYVLDDQGSVRKHVAIFINGELQDRRTVLDRAVEESEEIYILQALSGG